MHFSVGPHLSLLMKPQNSPPLPDLKQTLDVCENSIVRCQVRYGVQESLQKVQVPPLHQRARELSTASKGQGGA